MSQTSWIVHICEQQAWDDARLQGEYRAASLASEGFIHASRPEQVLWVANQFYRNHPPLALLWIDPQRLESTLRFDPVGDDNFPHIYGPVNLSAIGCVTPFPPDEDGQFRRLPAMSTSAP